jgi:hypothetical protein
MLRSLSAYFISLYQLHKLTDDFITGLLTVKDGVGGMGNKAGVAVVNLPLFYGICIELSKAMKNLMTGVF